MNVITERYSLYEGDCLNILPALKGVDCIITDPPYGVGKAEWDSIFPAAWIPLAWRLTTRMLVMPGNTALVEAGNLIGQYKDCIVLYNLNGMTLSHIAFGNWIPVLACGDWKWEARPNVLRFVVRSKDEQIDHPSPKPLAAMKLLIQKYTKPDDLILDPFMGSGTTGVAALQLGRRFVGIELDSNYFQVAVKRIADAHRAAQGLNKQLRGKDGDLSGMPLFADIGG